MFTAWTSFRNGLVSLLFSHRTLLFQVIKLEISDELIYCEKKKKNIQKTLVKSSRVIMVMAGKIFVPIRYKPRFAAIEYGYLDMCTTHSLSVQLLHNWSFVLAYKETIFLLGS